MRALLLLLIPFLGRECTSARASDAARDRHTAGDMAASASSGARQSAGPIRVELLDANESPPTFVLRGEPKGDGRLVFLHGMCGHAHGYAQSFQHAAAHYGTLISPQADRLCGGGPWAKWSHDVEALDRRIVDAFRRLGHPDPIDDIAIIGYSQGATRAETLARRWPERYTRLISIGAPDAPSGRGLKGLKAAVMMAGEFDRRDQMHRGVRSMVGHGVPSTFVLIPGARHGAMGNTPEQTMATALDWLWKNSKAAPK